MMPSRGTSTSTSSSSSLVVKEAIMKRNDNDPNDDNNDDNNNNNNNIIISDENKVPIPSSTSDNILDNNKEQSAVDVSTTFHSRLNVDSEDAEKRQTKAATTTTTIKTAPLNCSFQHDETKKDNREISTSSKTSFMQSTPNDYYVSTIDQQRTTVTNKTITPANLAKGGMQSNTAMAVTTDPKIHDNVLLFETSNNHVSQLSVRKTQRTKMMPVTTRESHVISVDERQHQQQQQSTSEKPPLRTTTNAATNTTTTTTTAKFLMNPVVRQSHFSKQSIKSFIFGRRILWSLVSLYTVLLFLSFMQTSILEQSTLSSSLSSSSKSLSTLLKETNNNRPLLSQVDADQKKNQILQTYIDKRLAELSKPVSYKRPSYDPHQKTLALLYPQGMIGGYRNQVIRFISFVRYAKNNNISQMLLPSIVWSTVHVEANNRRRFFPVPMDMLFDIDHWNSFHEELPILVDSVQDSDCWGNHDIHEYRLPKRNDTCFISPLSQKVLDENALLTPIVNYSRSVLNGELQIRPRRFDLFPLVKNCTHPIVYGGGKGGGTLWNDFTSMPKVGIRSKVTPEAIENTRVISLINQALTPNRQWRNVAHQCVLQHQPTSSSSSSSDNSYGISNYVALHARVETDMMMHKCGKFMEKNLTQLFAKVDDLVDTYNSDKQEERDKMQGVFVAVSREGMKSPVNSTEVQEMADYNWNVLLERSITENPNRKTTKSTTRGADMFECGEIWTDRWYAAQQRQQQQQKDIDNNSSNNYNMEYDSYGSILPSIINFYIATHASIFIGVQGSSWSTDVWNTRYHQGKGNGNYEYTLHGIKQLSNGGLPPPHQNCKEIKFLKDTTTAANKTKTKKKKMNNHK